MNKPRATSLSLPAYNYSEDTMNRKDVKIETKRGSGPGGQHRNKTDSCVRATHIPTGISVQIDGRHQSKNKKRALVELEKAIAAAEAGRRAAVKKAKRDAAIRDAPVIRTYDYRRKVVKDHRTGKTASLRDILQDARLDLLNPSF